MAANPARYRTIQFVGGRILEARELNTLQNIIQGTDVNGATNSFNQDAIYRQGAILNGSFVINGSTASLVANDNTQPILVFVRDQWEPFLGSELTATTLTSSQTIVYLNWQLQLITSSDDPSLVDGATGQPTAEMGQLAMQLSATDDSARAVSATELAKNTTTIVVGQFGYVNGGYTQVPLDNSFARALATSTSSGLVKLTTGTSNGLAVANDDYRMSNARPAADGSVHDPSVIVPVTTGQTNADGTEGFDLTQTNGGINASKIILQDSKQILSEAWLWLKNAFNSLLNRYNAHEGIVLGLSNTHPFPTPSQVGATPLSHVGQPLNLPTSHPATVTQSSGGFSCNRVPNGNGTFTANPNDAAYGVFEGSNLRSGLMHTGDVYSALANMWIASPGGVGATSTGPLGLLSTLAAVVSQHVNQTNHSNPHGLTIDDLGGAGVSQGYVDQGDAGTLAAAKAYAVSIVPTLTLNHIYVGNGSYVVLRFAPNGLSGVGAIEVAFGSGTVSHGSQIPLPNGNFSYSNLLPTISPAIVGSRPNTVNQINYAVDLSSGVVTAQVNNNNGTMISGTASWFAVCWRVSA